MTEFQKEEKGEKEYRALAREALKYFILTLLYVVSGSAFKWLALDTFVEQMGSSTPPLIHFMITVLIGVVGGMSALCLISYYQFKNKADSFISRVKKD